MIKNKFKKLMTIAIALSLSGFIFTSSPTNIYAATNKAVKIQKATPKFNYKDDSKTTVLKEIYTFDNTNYFGTALSFDGKVYDGKSQNDGYTQVLVTSKDKINWEVVPFGTVNSLYVSKNCAIAKINDNFSSDFSEPKTYYTKNGVDWYLLENYNTKGSQSYTYQNGKFIMTYTTLGPENIPFSEYNTGIELGEGVELIYSDTTYLSFAYSYDGINWVDFNDEIYKKYGYNNINGVYGTKNGIVVMTKDKLHIGTIQKGDKDTISWKEKSLPVAPKGYTLVNFGAFDGKTFQISFKKDSGSSSYIYYTTKDFDTWNKGKLLNELKYNNYSDNDNLMNDKLNFKDGYITINGVKTKTNITYKGKNFSDNYYKQK